MFPMPGERSDEELMLAVADGDSRAFDALYERHSPTVYGFVCRMVKNTALAEDLLQTTFLSVLRSKDRYEPGMKVVPWLVTIAANAARDSLRRQQRHAVPVDDVSALDMGTVEQAPSDPGLRRKLEWALAALPAQQREAVVMHKVHGLSFDDIAESLGVTSTAARIRAHRGYERLRELLGPEEELS
jgi:RNA polymerase sigma factor (sigma-70 family)